MPDTTNPLADLLRLSEAYIDATEADCLVTPAGHESTCLCGPHIDVRERGQELRRLIEAIRNA